MGDNFALGEEVDKVRKDDGRASLMSMRMVSEIVG
jgi:hypothetical protein